MTLGMCPTLHLPPTTHFLFFMNFPIFPIKKIKKKKYFFSKNVKLGRLEGMIFLSMCAKYLVQTPSIASKNALVCAMACPWAAHGMPWCVPWQAMGCPWHALVCATTSHERAKLIFARANLANCASKFIA